jgi:hypothetical protein
MFHVAENQEAMYILDLPDVSCSTVALNSPSYFAPTPNASKLIFYQQLIEEIKMIL